MKLSRNISFLVCLLPAIVSANVVYQDYSVSRLQAADLSGITGGACYRQMNPSSCPSSIPGMVPLSYCGGECETVDKTSKCLTPNPQPTLPEACPSGGESLQFQIENNSIEVTAPASSGPDRFADRVPTAEVPCQVVYRCECVLEGMLMMCRKQIESNDNGDDWFCASSVIQAGEEVTAEPCEDE